MAVFVHDLVIRTNAGFEFPMTWIDKAKQPKPLSSYNAKMQIREYQGAPGDPLVSIDDGETGGITLAEAGDIDVFIPKSQTAHLQPFHGKTLEYDLVLIHKSDPEKTLVLVEGEVRPEPGVTT